MSKRRGTTVESLSALDDNQHGPADETSSLAQKSVSSSYSPEDPVAVLIEKYDPNQDGALEVHDVRALITELQATIHKQNIRNNRIFYVILFAVIVVLLQAAAGIGTALLGVKLTKEMTLNANGQLVSTGKTHSSKATAVTTRTSHSVFHIESNATKVNADKEFLKSTGRLSTSFTFLNTDVSCQEYTTALNYGQVKSNYAHTQTSGDTKLALAKGSSDMTTVTPQTIRYDKSTQTYHAHGWTEAGVSKYSGLFAICNGATSDSDKCAVCASDVQFLMNGTVAYGQHYSSSSNVMGPSKTTTSVKSTKNSKKETEKEEAEQDEAKQDEAEQDEADQAETEQEETEQDEAEQEEAEETPSETEELKSSFAEAKSILDGFN